MGEYDPIVIAVSLGVSLFALGAVYIVAWIERRKEERQAAVETAAVEAEPVVELELTEDDHFELWIQQIWPGASYAERVAEREWADVWEGRP